MRVLAITAALDSKTHGFVVIAKSVKPIACGKHIFKPT